jgi:hypothetical protein
MIKKMIVKERKMENERREQRLKAEAFIIEKRCESSCAMVTDS